MSTEIQDIQSSETVEIAAENRPESIDSESINRPESINSEQVQRPTASRGERIKALGMGKERDYYQRTGDLDGAERKLSARRGKDLPAAANAVETEPASGSGITEQPSQRTKQDRNFRAVNQKLSQTERELIEARAKLEVYERERAASGQSAPATPRTQATPVMPSDPRPRVPKLKDFDSVEKYDEAVEQWQVKDSEWVERQMDGRLTAAQQRQADSEAKRTWDSRLDEARKTHADFDQVALSDKTPVSYATMATIWSLTDGANRSYALGKNLEAATKIAELTAIPGENQHKTFGDFLKWVKTDPDRAMLYGEKLAIAKAELSKLVTGSKAPAAQRPTRPLKEVIRSTARPSAELDIQEPTGPPADPIYQTLQDIKNRVPGAQKRYNELRNKQDLARRNGR